MGNIKSFSYTKETLATIGISIRLMTLSLLFALVSCNNVNKEPVRTQTPVSTFGQEQPGTANPQPFQSPVNNAEVETNTAQNNDEVMLNPPHGQPFHRCDIPVGAPLNSQPAGTNQQSANNQTTTVAPQPATPAPNLANNPFAPTIENASRFNSSQVRNTQTATGSKPRLNPPHGQPFHRCDIAVGSPLPNRP